LWIFNELPIAVFTKIFLFAVVDEPVFNNFY
jgi:hypothetical protein